MKKKEGLMEEKFFDRAMKLAEKGRGKTSPNPFVGAVIVKDGEIVGEGFTQPYGQDHAEVQALKSAKEKAEYLLECIGNKLGDIISLRENDYKIDNHMTLSDKLPLEQRVNNSRNHAPTDNTSVNIRINNITITAHIIAEFEIN